MNKRHFFGSAIMTASIALILLVPSTAVTGSSSTAPPEMLSNPWESFDGGGDERSTDDLVDQIPFQDGWPVELNGWIFSDLVAGDVDGDGLPEVVVGDSRLHVLNHDGSEVAGWPQYLDQHVMSSPALADIDGDGRLEIVVQTYYSIYAFNHDGSILWQQSIDNGSISSPSIADIDGDGELEIVMGGTNQQGGSGHVYVWDHNGNPKPGWPKSIAVHLSSPALADLDHDGDLEIIIGSVNGYLYVWHHDGTTVSGWPRFVGGGEVRSPAVGDIDGDGAYEIIAGSAAGYVNVWETDGHGVSGWPQRTPIGTSILFYRASHPALGDLDRDGDLEVVVAADVTLHTVPGEPWGKVFAWHHDGTALQGWPVDSGDEWVTTSPLVVDIDDHGFLDVVAVSDRPDWVAAWNINGLMLQDFPLYPKPGSPTDMRATPLVTDLDGDGDLELVAASYDSSVYAWDIEDAYRPERIDWPMFQADARNTGVFSFADQVPPVIAFQTLERDLKVRLGEGIGGGPDERLDIEARDDITPDPDVVATLYVKGEREREWTLIKPMPYIRELHRGVLTPEEIRTFFEKGHRILHYRVTAEDEAGNMSEKPDPWSARPYTITIYE